MTLRAIEVVLIAVYKVVDGQGGIYKSTADVLPVCNKVMSMSEERVVELLTDLNALRLVATGMGGAVQLTPRGKAFVESSGLLDTWATIEKLV